LDFDPAKAFGFGSAALSDIMPICNLQAFYEEFCNITGHTEVGDMLAYYTRNNCSGSNRSILHCTAKFFRKENLWY
jgi:hypothetical protein